MSRIKNLIFPERDSIKIPMGRSDNFALICKSDYPKVNQWKWHLRHGYAVRADRINCKAGNDRTYIQMHRVIMDAEDGIIIDHINGDRSDNRRENLRLCTHIENSRNRKKQDDCTSTYKGVSIKDGLWISYIRVNGILKHLGRFEDEYKAAQCYNSAAIQYFGEFARLNDINETDKSWQELSSEAREKIYSKKYSSKYLGVSFNKQHKQWIAGFSRGSKDNYLSIFKNEADAAICVDAAIYEAYGNEFPRNFPNRPVVKTVQEILAESSAKTSQYIGVSKYKDGRWRARVNPNGKEHLIGYFNSEIAAALARDKYIIDNNIQRVKLNFQ